MNCIDFIHNSHFKTFSFILISSTKNVAKKLRFSFIVSVYFYDSSKTEAELLAEMLFNHVLYTVFTIERVIQSAACFNSTGEFPIATLQVPRFPITSKSSVLSPIATISFSEIFKCSPSNCNPRNFDTFCGKISYSF